MSAVTDVAAAPSPAALAHFEAQFAFETDCWDAHEALEAGRPDFVLLDLAHRKIVGSAMARYPDRTVFVVCWAGPHCNGAARAAIRLARLGRPVKLMTGGITGWRDEGFALSV